MRFLALCLIFVAAAAATCTKESCAELRIRRFDRGVSPSSITIDGARFEESSDYVLVPAGMKRVAVESSAFVTRIDCMFENDASRNSPMKGKNRVVSLLPGDRVECIVTSFAEPATQKREAQPIPNADVGIAKGGTNSIIVGSLGPNQYNLIVSNAGLDTAVNVTINDVVDSRLTIISVVQNNTAGFPVSCSVINNNVTCFSSTLPIFEYIYVVINYLAPSATSLVNTSAFTIPNRATVSTGSADFNQTNNFSDFDVVATVCADLTVRLALPQTVVAGAGSPGKPSGLYNATVCNVGPAEAINVVTVINLPNPAQLVRQGQAFPVNPTIGGSCVASGTVITCSGFNLTASSCQTFVVPMSAPSNAFPFQTQGTVVFVASASSDIFDCALVNNAINGTSVVQMSNDLRMTKSGFLTIVAGDPFGSFYNLIVTSPGPSQAYNITVFDTLPSPERYIPGSLQVTGVNGAVVGPTDSCSFNGAGTVLFCFFQTIIAGPPGSANPPLFAIRFNFTVPPNTTATVNGPNDPRIPTPEAIVNTAQVVSITPDPNPLNNINSGTTDVINIASLSIQKSCLNPGPITSGDLQTIQFSIQAQNGGPSVASGVVIYDPLPTQFRNAVITNVFGPISCDLPFNAATNQFILTCNATRPLNPIIPGGGDVVSVLISFQIQTGLTSFITALNNATISTTTSINFSSQTWSACTVQIQPPPDVNISKTGPASILVNNASEVHQYVLQAFNKGPITALNVIIKDTVNSLFIVRPDLASVSAPGQSYSWAVNCAPFSSGNNVECRFATLAVGSSIFVTIPFTVPLSVNVSSVPNCATVSDLYDVTTGDKESCIVTPLQYGADISVSKNTESLCAGNSGTYRLFVSNAGPADSQSVTLTDTFNGVFTALNVQSVTVNGLAVANPCTINNQFLSCTFAVVRVNDVVQVNVGYTIAPTTAAQSVRNEVSVTSPTFDPNPNNNNNFFVSSITACPNLQILKTGPAQVTAGGASGVYTLRVTNNGPSAALNPTVTDTLPLGLTFLSAQTSGPYPLTCFGTFDNLSQRWTVTCPFQQSFLPGDVELIFVNFNVAPDVPAQTVQNCATVTSQNVPPNTATNCTTTPIVTPATVVLTKVGPSNCIVANGGSNPSGLGAYVVTVTNQGPAQAYTLQLTDVWPSSFNLFSGPLVTGINANGVTPTCSVTANGFQCNIGNVSPNQTISVAYTLSASRSQQNQTGLVNVATLSQGCSVACNPTVQTASWTSSICAFADLSIQKTTPDTSFIAGDNVVHTFRLSVLNSGPSDAYNVWITDTQFVGGNFNSISSSNPSFTCFLGNLSCYAPVFPASATSVITLTFTIPASQACGTYPNTGTITSLSTYDNNLGNNVNTISINVVVQPTLRVVKQGLTVVNAGQGGLFWVLVSNQGPSDAAAVTFTDFAPQQLNITGVSPTPACSWSQQLITCNLGTLAPGQQVNVTYTYNVSPDVPLPSPSETLAVNNTACIATAGNGQFCLPSSACSSFITTIKCVNNLNITKSNDAVGPILAGGGATNAFTIQVVNIGGPSAARNVRVTDTWPAGLTPTTYISSSFTCQFNLPTILCTANSALEPNLVYTIVIPFTVPPTTAAGFYTNRAEVASDCDQQGGGVTVATSTVQVRNIAAINIIKDDCVDTIVAGGDPVTYRLTVTNNGPSAASVLTVTDLIPLPFELVGTPSTSGQVIPDQCLTTFIPGNGTLLFCVYTSFPAQETGFISFTVRLGPAVPPGFITNCAQISATNQDSNFNNHEDCDTDRIVVLADLEITKSINPTTCIVAGQTVTPNPVWTVTVRNKGPSVARNVVVHEVFPRDVIILAVPAGCVANPAGSNNYTCVFANVFGDDSLSVGETATLSFTFSVPSYARPGLIVNYADVTSTTPDPEPCNNNVTLPSLICAQSDLGITKNDNVTVVTAGDGVFYRYEIVGTNYGPSDAHEVTITDIWPRDRPGFRLVQIVGANCTNNTNGFTCDVGSIPVGGSYSFCVIFTVDACTLACEQCNAVSILSSSIDPNPSNNVAEDCDKVRTEADLAVCKDDGVDVVTAGDGIVYTYNIKVTNLGPSCAQNVRLVDHFPPQVLQVPGTLVIVQGRGSCIVVGSGGLVNSTAQDFSCDFGTLEPGQTVTIVVSYTVPASTSTCSINNVAIVSSTTFDPVMCNNDAKDVNALIERAQLRATKTSSSSSIPIDLTKNYTFNIVVTNLGPSTARDVTLTDQWPQGLCQYLESVRYSQGYCVTTGGDITCSFGDLAVGSNISVAIPYSVCQGAVPGPITNKVSAFSPTDSQCRDANSTVVLFNLLRKREEKRAVIPPAPVVPEVAAAMTSRVVKPAEKKQVAPFEVDPRLPAAHMRVEAQHTGAKQFEVSATNTNKNALRVIQFQVDLRLKDGRTVTADLLTSGSDLIKENTCTFFAERRVPGGWAQRCSVVLADKVEAESVRFQVVGGMKTVKGNQAVLGEARIQM